MLFRARATTLDPRNVSVWRSERSEYPSTPPFHPSSKYPEYLFEDTGSEANCSYEAVRGALFLAGLDAARFNTPEWNPLGELINPGETVLLKPNMVKENHPRDPEGWRYVLTHGSVIRAVADYVAKALGGRGRIVVADGPQTDSSFSRIVQVLGLDSIREFYNALGIDFEVIDLRKAEWTARDEVIVERRSLTGDPCGEVAFDLAQASEFAGHHGAGRYYGADYDERQVNLHHSGGRHEYLVCGTALQCDVILSLPKLKTHKKAGITATLKNLVGINADKNWLPHHTEGDPRAGGDEHPDGSAKHRLERAVAARIRHLSLAVPGVGTWVHRNARKAGKHVFGDSEQVIRSGNWWGNDTIWRMCLDLNKVVAYGEPDGSLRRGVAENRKRHFALVDGIIGGEGSGPANPDPVDAGIVAFGVNAASVDASCAYLMGFDPELIPIVRQAFCCREFPLAEWSWRDVRLVSNDLRWNGLLPNIADSSTLHFEPHFGWRGHIERTAPHSIERVAGLRR